MISRRNLLIGATCLAGAAAGYEVTPHRRLSLLGSKKMAAVVPTTFGEWTSRDASDLAPPVEEGSEVARIYDELVERVYRSEQTGAQIMMLIAHGPSQTNELMLHRPEYCYPANGYAISQSAITGLPLGHEVTLPVRKLVADARSSRENITYWTRLGEYLPTSQADQRTTRLVTVVHGYVADGVLARFSVIEQDPKPAMALLAAFIPNLMKAVHPADRAALIGTSRAAAMNAAGV